MTIKEIATAYLNLLWSLFQYDIGVFSQPWLYYWALVPAIGYLCFFFVKWAVLTMPLWLPLHLMFGTFHWKDKSDKKKINPNCRGKSINPGGELSDK